MADNNNPVENNIAPNGFETNPRDRLFHTIFIKAASVYIRVVPKWCRGFLEVLVLAKALLLFTSLSYIHFTFSKYPMDCLDKLQDNWPRDGILQIQIIKDRSNMSMKKIELPPYFASKWNHSLAVSVKHREDQCGIFEHDATEFYSNTSKEYEVKTKPTAYVQTVDDEYLKKREKVFYETLFNARFHEQQAFFTGIQNIMQYYENKHIKDHYVMEYSLEYGFLRLSQEARKKFNIPVEVVSLDPKVDKCFGDSLNRFILDKFLGYDDLLMASIKKLAEKEGNRGYMKNVISGEHYKFVTMWMGRTSYTVSFLLMFVFTISISTLLRFCHQQIFIFIIHLLHVMDWNASLAFPIAPMFTVILSLVGMEAIMAEFFNDTTTSFYIILIVWAADQFDSICCHTRLSQKYWLRFFYLYHFLFYAYHYRFNGQYSTIALAASWFFIQHSMLYFLHNYEIPAIEAVLIAQGGNYLDEAVELLVDEMQLPLVPENTTAQGENGSSNEQPGSEQTPVVRSGENENESTNEATVAANDENPVYINFERESGLGNETSIDHDEIELSTEVYSNERNESQMSWPQNDISFDHQIEAETNFDEYKGSIAPYSENNRDGVCMVIANEAMAEEPGPCHVDSNGYLESTGIVTERTTQDAYLLHIQNEVGSSSSLGSVDCPKETFSAKKSNGIPVGQEKETDIVRQDIYDNENSTQCTDHLQNTLDIVTLAGEKDTEYNQPKTENL